MLRRPLPYQRQVPPGQFAGEQRAVDRDRGNLAAVLSVEVRDRMAAFVPEHGDRDPVEEADTWHRGSTRASLSRR